MENFKCRHHQYDSYFLPWKEDEKMSMLVVGTKKKTSINKFSIHLDASLVFKIKKRAHVRCREQLVMNWHYEDDLSDLLTKY